MNTRNIARAFVAIGVVFLLTSCAKSPESRLVGEWTGTDQTGVTASLVFNEDGSAKIIHGDIEISGDSIGGTMVWKLDASHDPMQLDLVLSKPEALTPAGKSITFPMIVRFVEENTIEVCMTKDRKTRPAHFSKYGEVNQLILDRQ